MDHTILLSILFNFSDAIALLFAFFIDHDKSETGSLAFNILSLIQSATYLSIAL